MYELSKNILVVENVLVKLFQSKPFKYNLFNNQRIGKSWVVDETR